jgi:uncharacterized protein (UPF0128 family)
MEKLELRKNRSAFQRISYYYKNNGLQNQSVLYRKMPKEPKRFLRSQHFSKDGTTSLGGLDFSKDGSKVAYAISEGGRLAKSNHHGCHYQ